MVFKDTKSFSAISLFDKPLATLKRTSSSRKLKSVSIPELRFVEFNGAASDTPVFLFPSLLPKYIPSFTWGADGSVKYQLDKALADIQNWMVFKHRELDLEQIKTLIEIYNKQQ